MKKRARSLVIIVLAALTGLVSFDWVRAAEPAKLKPITVMLDWRWDGKHLFIFAAQRAKAFEAEGLEVRFQPPASPGDSNKFVAAQTAEFGLAFTTDHVVAAENIPGVVSIADFVRRSPHGVGALKGFGLTGPRALIGKRVALSQVPVSQIMFDAFLKQGNLSRKDLQQVATAGFIPAQLLAQGKTDVNVGVDYALVVQLRSLGHEIEFLYFRDFGAPDYPFATIISHAKYLEKNGDVARAFLRALWKGMEIAQRDPGFALEWAAKNHPELNASALKATWDVVGPQMVDDVTRSKGYGWHDFEKWQALADFLYKSQLTKRSLPARELATDAYLK